MGKLRVNFTAAELIEEAFRGKPVASAQPDPKSQAINRMRFTLGRSSSLKSQLGAVSGKPEAVVKNIRKGGVNNARELRRQIKYLTDRDYGKEEILYNGKDVMTSKQVEDLISSWSDGFQGTQKQGHTRHMIVSFPEGTNPEAAREAGLEFAEQVFGSGQFGDVWDYVSVFHNDTDNPHVHLVVKCRGIEDGTWLKMSMRDEMNSDRLRSIQAEIAEDFGIELTATTRAERGLMYGASDEVYLSEQRKAQLVENASEIEEVAQEAAIQVISEQYEQTAKMFERFSGIVSDQILSMAAQLKEGEAAVISENANLFREADSLAAVLELQQRDAAPRALVNELAEHVRTGQRMDDLGADLTEKVDRLIATLEGRGGYVPFLSSLADLVKHDGFRVNDEYMDRSERIKTGIEASVDAMRFEELDRHADEITTTLEGMEKMVATVGSASLRAELEGEISDLKAKVAPLLPYDPEMQAYTVPSSDYGTGYSNAIVSTFEGEDAVKWQSVRSAILTKADTLGVDGKLFLARHLSRDAVSVGQAAEWREREVNDLAASIRENLGLSGGKVGDHQIGGAGAGSDPYDIGAVRELNGIAGSETADPAVVAMAKDAVDGIRAELVSSFEKMEKTLAGAGVSASELADRFLSVERSEAQLQSWSEAGFEAEIGRNIPEQAKAVVEEQYQDIRAEAEKSGVEVDWLQEVAKAEAHLRESHKPDQAEFSDRYNDLIDRARGRAEKIVKGHAMPNALADTLIKPREQAQSRMEELHQFAAKQFAGLSADLVHGVGLSARQAEAASMSVSDTARVGLSGKERKVDTVGLSDIERIERAVKDRAASIADDDGFSL